MPFLTSCRPARRVAFNAGSPWWPISQRPALVVSAALSQVKSPHAHSNINPNRILQSLIAVLAGLNIPLLCTETHELGEEVVASYLYQIHLYDWLETNDYGRSLVDNDL